MDTEQERQFYRLAAERAFDPERFDRMNERAKKVAEERNSARLEGNRKSVHKYYRSEKGRKQYEKRRNRIKTDPAYRERFLECQRASNRRKYMENPEYYLSRAREYYRKNREKINARKREKYRSLTAEEREKVRERVNANNRKYYHRQKYYYMNREKILAYQKELWKKRKAENGKQN